MFTGVNHFKFVIHVYVYMYMYMYVHVHVYISCFLKNDSMSQTCFSGCGTNFTSIQFLDYISVIL